MIASFFFVQKENQGFGCVAGAPPHSNIGRWLWQNGHAVTLYCALQCGQTACVRNVSKVLRHRLQPQNSPTGGEVWHTGHENSLRRGAFSNRNNTCACRYPVQQFRAMNAATIPSHQECIKTAASTTPPTPTNPSADATIKLLARPMKNHSNDRRIWPPSSG